MLSKLSSCFNCAWKAPTAVGACQKTSYDALFQRTLSHYCVTCVSLIPRRYFGRSAVRLESQVDFHTTELNSASKKQDTSNSQNFDERLFQMMANNDGLVPMSRLLRALKNCGLWMTDRRLRESVKRMRKYIDVQQSEFDAHRDVLLTKEMFAECTRDNVVLFRKAFGGSFVIPAFSDFCGVIDEIYWECRTHSDGKMASYIPQLARYSRDHWAVSLCSVDGQRHSIGDVDVPFTIQSGSMPINYALAMNEVGPEVVHQYVGHEPIRESVAYIKLNQDKKPHNPLINSGAIIVTSLLKRNLSAADKFDHILSQYRRLAGGEMLGFNNAVFVAEKERAYRNLALGYYMKENGCFPDDANLQQTMDLYFQLCSVDMTVNTGAVMAATLANGGQCPITCDSLLNPTSVCNTLSLMHSCGMYDYSGGFAFKVGLPAKSTVSGCIILVVPNVLGLCLWSPLLDKMGNSARSIKFCETLVSRFNFHHYDSWKRKSQKNDPRLCHSEVQSRRIINLLFAAYNGDLTALQRMSLTNQDVSIADYDGRTALHVAAAEGHLECVRFLVEKCGVPLTPRDRWNHTPADDADRFHRYDVVKFLREWTEKSANCTVD